MKKFWAVLLACLLFITGCKDDGFDTITIDPNETKITYGVWVSYLEFQSILQGKSEEEYTVSVKTMMSNLESLGINKIYAHASAFTDAFYPSEYYPMSRYASGSIGKTLSYDPFQILVSEADFRGIQVEAWINPMRSFTESEMSSLSSQYPVKKWYSDENLRAERLMYAGDRYYLNPGSEAVIELINNVANELLSKYKIAGIHIDDYFYPPEMTDELDQVTFDQYLETHADASRSSYRLAMTDRLVKSLYSTVHAYEDKVFSISPNANVRTNLETYYSNVEKWFKNSGYCDEMIPQIYFGFENSNMPFKEIADEWSAMATGRVKLLFGLAAYKVGQYDQWAGEGTNEWIENSDVLSKQVEYVKEARRYGGVVFFRYLSMFYPDSEIYDQMQLELSKLHYLLK